MDEEDYAALIEQYSNKIEEDKRQIFLYSILLLIISYKNYFIYGNTLFMKQYEIIFRYIITLIPSITIIRKDFDKRLSEDIVASLTGNGIKK